MSAITIALRVVAEDATGGAFGSLAGRLFSLMGASNLLGNNLLGLTDNLQHMTGTALGAGAAFALFSRGLGDASNAAGQLEFAATMATIAISDGTQHVQEISDAIVNLANTSVYKIADVDMAFRILGERGSSPPRPFAWLRRLFAMLLPPCREVLRCPAYVIS